jgi:hypothetical protein
MFTSPISLLLLLPWVGVTIWLLWGRRHTRAVPFLNLWPSDQPVRRARRRVQLPPMALGMALLAMLLAIVSSAGPIVRTRGARDAGTITLILDRGITMSADHRRQQVLDQAAEALRLLGPGPLDFVPVPDGRVHRTDRRAWLATAEKLPGTRLDTHDAVALAIRQAIDRGDGPVLVLTDHSINSTQRTIQIAPSTALANVGIVHLAARAAPRAQVMVTLRNQSDLSRASLQIISGDKTITRAIDLPAGGQVQDYFFDLPAMGETVTAQLQVHDDLPADNVAYLARRSAWPVIEIRTSVPPEVRRVIEAYSRARPSSEGAAHVSVVSSIDQVRSDEPAVVVAEVSGPTLPQISPSVISHPVTRDVDWASLSNVMLAPHPPAGWNEILKLDNRAAVAVRPQPARQVWIGFQSQDFARSSDFPVFWTNVVDWVGQAASAAGESYGAATSSMPLPVEWQRIGQSNTEPRDPDSAPQPGLYRRSDGALRAVNLPPVSIDPLAPQDWRAGLAALNLHGHNELKLAPWLLIAALLCLLGSSLLWAVVRLTPFYPPRTV